jgi:hypothetical protein
MAGRRADIEMALSELRRQIESVRLHAQGLAAAMKES